jgi:hypothetical protein
LKEGAAIQVVHGNAPSADRIVCRGRAGEQIAPPRGSVSDGRQPTSGTSRPPRWVARLQARVGSGSASPPPGRADEPGQRTVSLASLAGGPCVCWPTRRCCQVGTLPGGAIGPNFCGTLGRCRTVLGSATPSEAPVRQGLVLLVALGHLPAGLRRPGEVAGRLAPGVCLAWGRDWCGAGPSARGRARSAGDHRWRPRRRSRERGVSPGDWIDPRKVVAGCSVWSGQ